MAITFLTNEDKNIIDGQINKNAEDIGRLSEEFVEQIDSIKNDMYVAEGEDIIPSSEIFGYMLNLDGMRESSSTRKIVIYDVIPGENLALYIIRAYKYAACYQFQNSAEVPKNGNDNPYIVGETVGSAINVGDAFDGIVVVPEGATHLIVTQDKDNTVNKVQRVLEHGKSRIDTLESYHANNIFNRNTEVLPMIHAAAHHGHSADGEWNISHQFTMMVTTDVHGDSVRLKSALDYMDGVDQFDAGISLGDMQPGYFNDNDGTWFTNAINNAQKPVYPVIGNHDAGNTDDTTKSATKSQQFAKFFQPVISKIGMPDLTKTYYSVNTGHGVTMIVLDTHDVPDTMSGDKFAVARGVVGFSQAQIDWLIATLQGVPADGHVLIAGHTLSDAITDVDCSWTQKYTEGVATNDYPGMIPEIVHAWQTGASLIKTYTPVVNAAQATIQVNADFTSRGEGVFAGYLMGHWHKDVVAKMTAYPNQNVIRLASTSLNAWQNESSDLPRVEGIKSEDCVTALTVDTITRKIKLVRIGSNITFDMVRRDMIAIPY